MDFLLNPTSYSVPGVDLWLASWANAIDQFIVTNPYTTTLLGIGTTWFVKRTPWGWDDKVLEWIKKKFA